MDVLSALIAYEQKLTMCLSSSSFYCRLRSSKHCCSESLSKFPWAEHCPSEEMAWEALTMEIGWGGEQMVTLRKGRVISTTLVYSCSYAACWNGGISIDFAFFCSADWWASEEAAAFWGHVAHGGACPTACAALLRPSRIFGFPSVPRTDKTLYPSPWCAEWSYIHLLSKDPCVSQLYSFVLKKSFAFVIVY